MMILLNTLIPPAQGFLAQRIFVHYDGATFTSENARRQSEVRGMKHPQICWRWRNCLGNYA